MSRALIITGATGTQGGALIQALVEADADFEIIAVSRDPSSRSAQRLVQKSPKIKVIAGNMEAADAIFESAKKVTSAPIWGVYSVQMVMGSMNPWDEAEVRQGKSLVDAALKNKVTMFVYSSVDRGGDAKSYQTPTYVPHFRTKHEIEHHLVERARDTDMSYTILRPVAFMNNFQPGFPGKIMATAMSHNGPQSLQLVAASDIGYFGAQAFMHPDRYQNRGISLAGDEVTYAQLSATFKQTTGQEIPTTYSFLARLVTWLSRDLSLMLKFFRTEGFEVDIEGLRKVHPRMKTFADWLVEDSPFVKQRQN